MTTPRRSGTGRYSWSMWTLVVCGVFGPTAWAATPADPGRSRTIGDVIREGGAIFAREWTANDPRSHGGDGLGPVYNAASCLACHGQGGPGGAGPSSKNAVLLSAPAAFRAQSGRASKVARPRDSELEAIHPGFRDARSLVLHRSGTDPEYEAWLGNLVGSGSDTGASEDPPLSFLESIRGMSDPSSFEIVMSNHKNRAASAQVGLRYRRTALAAARRGSRLTLSERNAPALFGAGAIDAVPEAVLAAKAEAQPAEVRGRISRMKDGQVGRFGWKAQTPTLRDFVFSACANELGLEVPDHHQAASPLAFEARTKGLDLDDDEVNALTIYIQFLPTPAGLDRSGSSASARGRSLFETVGCATCHSPSLGAIEGIYSDLLLHEMGPSLSDSGNYYGEDDPESPGAPKGSEWRTPPLWVFRDSGPYLHDGRARTLLEAVAFHDGQGKASAMKFFALSPLEQFQVQVFLNSLVAPATAKKAGELVAFKTREDDLLRQIESDDRIATQLVAASVASERQKREDAERAACERRDTFEAHRAGARLRAAQGLEKMGKIQGALDFYRSVVLDNPKTVEAVKAAERIEILEQQVARGR